jgi:bacillithiol system protein YtxJ
LSLHWLPLKDLQQLDAIIEQSKDVKFEKIAIFKHSTRCTISDMVKNRLEKSAVDKDTFPVYYLDLIAYRNISNRIAELFDVDHESPQVLIIKNGKSVYNASHFDIRFDEIVKQL